MAQFVGHYVLHVHLASFPCQAPLEAGVHHAVNFEDFSAAYPTHSDRNDSDAVLAPGDDVVAVTFAGGSCRGALVREDLIGGFLVPSVHRGRNGGDNGRT